MSGGLPDAKPCASCWPRSDATTTFTWIPDCLDQALAAFLTAKVSAGPELPISAVSVVALLRAGEPSATPAVMARAATVTAASESRQRTVRKVRSGCTKYPPWGSCRDDERSLGSAVVEPAPWYSR